MAAEHPSHNLTISFDLENNLLQGHSEIRLPAQQGATIHFDELSVFEIKKDGLLLEQIPSRDLIVEPSDMSQELVITYKKVFLPEAGSRTDTVSQQGVALTGTWYPVLDTLMLFNLSATIPANFQAISAGDETLIASTGSQKTVSFNFPYAQQSLAFLAGPFAIKKTPFGDGKILYTFFASDRQKQETAYREKALSLLTNYEDRFGAYPFNRFTIAENFLPSNISMPTLLVLGRDAIEQSQGDEASLRNAVLRNWFGGIMGSRDAESDWRAGLNTYLTAFDGALSPEAAANACKHLLLEYLSFTPSGSGVSLRGIPEAPEGEAKREKENSITSRNKAAVFFHMLNQKIGNDAFQAGIKTLFSQKTLSSTGWDGVLAAMNDASGQDLADFFSQWLDRTDIPVLGIKSLTLEEKEGQAVLAFHLTQEQDKPYHLQIPIEITTIAGKTMKVVDASGKETKVEIALDNSPNLLTIDPDYTLFRNLVPDEIPPTWDRFAGADEKLVILPPKNDEELFRSMIDYLQGIGCQTIAADAATDADLANKSVIFLGTDTPIARSVFATPEYPEDAVTINVRENPLGPGHVTVLVTAANAEDLSRAVETIISRKKFSLLSVRNGKIEKQAVDDSELGQIYLLDSPPQGMATANSLDFKEIIDILADHQVVYVGESHTRNEDHILQLRVIRALYAQNPNLAIGMEMFNQPSQQVLDDYVTGAIDEREFLKKSHYFEKWRFDYRFYRDIISFARKQKIPVVALNLEKDIVSKVFKEGGINALTEEEKEIIPNDRDLDLPGYRNRISQAFGMHGAHGKQNGDMNNFLQAQALWDETMAESVARYLSEHAGSRMVVVAGQGHTDKENGIPPRVARRLPGVKQSVLLNSQIGAVPPSIADFVLFAPPAPLAPTPLIGVMLEDKDGGLTVTNLSEQGKAKEAGIRKDDIILSIDNEPVQKMEDLKIVMFYKKKGETITLRLKRKGFFGDKIVNIDITL